MLAKRNILLILILFYVSAVCFANLHIIDVNKLPTNEVFGHNMATLNEIYQYVGHYSFEWNYPIDKNNLIEFLQAFHENINHVNTANDYELNLLDTIILTYLYNLDAENIFVKIHEKIDKMKKDYPDEYRSYWLYGNFLISAAKPSEGYYEFKQMLEKFDIDLNIISLNFLYDYAYACIMVQMFKTGMYILESAEKRGGAPAAANSLYQSISKSANDVEIKNTYQEKDVWRVIKNNNNYYLQSRMLGSLLPLKETWGLRVFGIENRKSICIITPDELISKKGREIQINILIEYDIGNETYFDFRQRKQNNFPITNHSVLQINNQEYDVFTFEDPSKYQNMGGAKGYYITTCLKYSPKTGVKIELPIEMNFSGSGNDGPHYYRISDFYNRINKDINVGILVDSSEEIFEEASDFIFAYLENIIFE